MFNKKIILVLMLGILLVSTVSAFEFDNKKTYDSTTETVTIRNSLFGIPTTKVATIELLTPHHNIVEVGKDRLVAQIEVDLSASNYKNFISKMEFYSLQTSSVQRIRQPKGFTYKKFIVDGTNTVNEYQDQCQEVNKGNGTTLECSKVKTGSHLEDYGHYEALNPKDEINKGKIVIGIFADVRPGDKTEWIPTMFGQRVHEWAFYEAAKTDDPGIFYHSITAGQTLLHGLQIFAKKNVTVTTVTRNPNSTATTAQILNSSFGVLGSVAFVGQNASMFVNLTAHKLYYVAAYSGGGGYTRSTNTTMVYPINGSNVNWTAGLSNAVNPIATQAYNIKSITSKAEVVLLFVNLTVPLDNALIGGSNRFISQVFQNTTDVVNGTLFIWNSSKALQITQRVDMVNNTFFTLVNLSGNINDDGTHHWNTYLCRDDFICDFAPVNFTVFITTKPPEINITSPNTTINLHKQGETLNLNWSITSGVAQTCLYSYNSVNTTIPCGDNGTTFTPLVGIDTLTFYANNSLGILGNTTKSWTIKVFEHFQTFENITNEGALEDFLANVTIDASLSLSQLNYYYNKTPRVGSTSFASGTNTILRNLDFAVPNIDATTNFNFTWQLILSDSSVVNLTKYNQTVNPTSIDGCTGNNRTLLNFTLVDEEFQTRLVNTTIEVAAQLFSSDGSILVNNYSNSFSKINPVTICINNITGATQYLLSSTTRYIATNYANEYYNIVNATLKNNTAIQHITLYDLNASDSTEFQVTFKGDDFVAVEGALINLKRQYISENRFKTVELPLTDSNGQTVLHLVRNSVIYTIEVIKSGVVLGTFSNINAFCDDVVIGDCKINLNAFADEQPVFSYSNTTGLSFTTPTYDNTTRTVSFNFLTSTGVTRTVNLTVTRNDIFGNNTVCSNTLVSSGGTLSCIVPTFIDDTTLRIEVRVDGELSIIDSIKLASTNFGKMGYFMMFIFMLSFMMLFVESKTMNLIGIGLGFITGTVLGLIEGKVIGLGASGIWLIVVIILMVWKLNKDRAE